MSDVNAPAGTPIFNPPPIRGNRKVYTSINGGDEIIWSHGGTVNPQTAETGSPWPAPFNLTLDTLTLTLAAVTNVALSIATTRNGVLLRTDTMPTATLVITYTLGITMTAGQTLQPILLAASTGTGVGLGVIYRYHRSV